MTWCMARPTTASISTTRGSGTDTITGGSVINKGLFVYRHAEPGLLRSPRILRFLQLAKELESLCACLALDIEFGLDRTGKLYLFQVRRMARGPTLASVTERRVARQLEFVERFVQECSLPREGVGRRADDSGHHARLESSGADRHNAATTVIFSL